MNAMSGVTFAGFVVAWVLMMAAMMFPAVVPVVRLYSRAAALGRVAPTGAFVAGYLLVWSAIALPAYVAWRALRGPLASGAHWSGYLAGGLLLAAGAYQLSPMKQACLRHCRTPMSVFLRQRRDLRRPVNALLAGGSHGLVCLGCCWAFMAVLIAFGTMTLTWMLVIAAAIFAEKVLPGGRRIAFGFAAALAGLGIALVTYPSLITSWS
jgi:predicted metal-binding membrane protein